MSGLDADVDHEKRRIADLARRARTRLAETTSESEALQAKGSRAAADCDTKGAGELERRALKTKALQRRYQELVEELEGSGDSIAFEILLARLQGPEFELLSGEVERNRDLLIQRATALLRARDRHRALRQRWGELTEKIRSLREARSLPPSKAASLEFRVPVTPQTYSQKPDGPTLRDVSDLIHQLGL